MTFNQQDDSDITPCWLHCENYQACSIIPVKSLLYCVIKASPARPSVRLGLYFIFQSQAVWCNCSKGTIWYFGFLSFFSFLRGGGLISFVPEGLSGIGWLDTANVHAQHARDRRHFTSTRGKWKTRNIYIQFASVPKTPSLWVHHSMRLPLCVYILVCVTN